MNQQEVILEGYKKTLNDKIDGIDIDELEAKKAEFEPTIQTLKSSIEANKVMIAQLEGQLPPIEENIAQLDNALQEVYQGNLIAAIEFANAQSTISLGEFQLNSAEAQL